MSAVTTFGIADIPAKPNSPVLVISTKTSIEVEWELSSSTQGEAGTITGY